MQIEDSRMSIDVMGSPMGVVDVGRGDTVVLGHSYLWDAMMWRPQIEALSKHYRVIVPELWGHGRSGPLPQGTQDLRDLAKQYLLLLDRLGVERFALAGLSIGGMWGTELALLAPQRLSGLVLMDTYVGAEPAELRARYFSMFNVVEQAKGFPDSLIEVVVPLYFSATVNSRSPQLPAGLRAALREWNRDRLLDSVIPIGRIIFSRRDALADLHDFPFPVMVMTGADDIPRPTPEGREMAQRLGCPYVEIPRAGHISSLEAPEAVTRHLEDFFGKAFG
jgi:pimeloyl-ACP methyl ester carboxylesterase